MRLLPYDLQGTSNGEGMINQEFKGDARAKKRGVLTTYTLGGPRPHLHPHLPHPAHPNPYRHPHFPICLPYPPYPYPPGRCSILFNHPHPHPYRHCHCQCFYHHTTTVIDHHRLHSSIIIHHYEHHRYHHHQQLAQIFAFNSLVHLCSARVLLPFSSC